jgi:butyryl-CoA dehydrogenase
VTARTDPGEGHRGITSLIVTKDTVDIAACRAAGVGHVDDLPKIAGVSAGKKEEKWGGGPVTPARCISRTRSFPRKNVLGKRGEGSSNS